MAKDDMNLIIYKILRYLYGCNKSGKTTTFSDMFSALEFGNIPPNYLSQILSELIDAGYIKGVMLTPTKGVTVITVSDNARITLKGVEYLDENSRMKKAADRCLYYSRTVFGT